MQVKINGKAFKEITRNEISKIGLAMADPKRIEILDLLSQGSYNVNQLAGSMKSGKALVSHHLQILKGAGMVESRKTGRFVYYSMPLSALRIWHTIVLNAGSMNHEILTAINSFFEDTHEFESADYNDLVCKIKSGQIVLIDVRPESEYSAGHFPGAVSMPMETIRHRFSEIPADRQVIAYCRGPLCVMAEDAVSFLRSRKYEAYRWKQSVMDWQNLPEYSRN